MKISFITSFFLFCAAGITNFAFSADIQARLENNNLANGVLPNVSSQTMVPAHFIDLGGYAILVEKTAQKLYLYDRDYKIIKTFNVTTGQRLGDKKKMGDFKTPEGVYFFTVVKDDKELLPEYGVMALPINYPNPIDMVLHKGGNGIWLHATNQPTRPLKPYDTRGCIVAANEDILELAEYIKLQSTPMVIVDRIDYDILEHIKSIRHEIYRLIETWQASWEKKDIDSYTNTYSKSFRSNGMDWMGWKKYKERLNSRYENIKVSLSDIKILSHDNHMIVSFVQHYKNNKMTSFGVKRLYLANEGGSWKIMGEEWNSFPAQQPANIAKMYIANNKGTGISKGKIPQPQNVAQNNIAALQQHRTEVKKEPALPSNAQIVDIEGFTLKGEKTAAIRFRLVNKTMEKHKISGRLTIVAANKNGNEISYTSYPPMRLEQGAPKDFRSGEWFSIRHFKIVNAAVEEKELSLVSVLVYSKNGELLLNKKFPVQIKQ